MKIVSFLIMCIFLLFSESANASLRSMCPDKVLETNTVEGVFQGADCGDLCYASIKLPSGEDFEFICDIDEVFKTFGDKPGNRVSVTYELKQFWNIYGEECSRSAVYKSGKILAQSQNQQPILPTQSIIQHKNIFTNLDCKDILNFTEHAGVYIGGLLEQYHLLNIQGKAMSSLTGDDVSDFMTKYNLCLGKSNMISESGRQYKLEKVQNFWEGVLNSLGEIRAKENELLRKKELETMMDSLLATSINNYDDIRYAKKLFGAWFNEFETFQKQYSNNKLSRFNDFESYYKNILRLNAMLDLEETLSDVESEMKMHPPQNYAEYNGFMERIRAKYKGLDYSPPSPFTPSWLSQIPPAFQEHLKQVVSLSDARMQAIKEQQNFTRIKKIKEECAQYTNQLDQEFLEFEYWTSFGSPIPFFDFICAAGKVGVFKSFKAGGLFDSADYVLKLKDMTCHLSLHQVNKLTGRTPPVDRKNDENIIKLLVLEKLEGSRGTVTREEEPKLALFLWELRNTWGVEWMLLK